MHILLFNARNGARATQIHVCITWSRTYIDDYELYTHIHIIAFVPTSQEQLGNSTLHQPETMHLHFSTHIIDVLDHPDRTMHYSTIVFPHKTNAGCFALSLPHVETNTKGLLSKLIIWTSYVHRKIFKITINLLFIILTQSCDLSACLGSLSFS